MLGHPSVSGAHGPEVLCDVVVHGWVQHAFSEQRLIEFIEHDLQILKRFQEFHHIAAILRECPPRLGVFEDLKG